MRAWGLLLALAVAFTACGPKSMKQRLRDAERAADATSSALDDAERAAAELEPDKMDAALGEAKKAMGRSDFELYPEATMLTDRYGELEKKAPAVRAEREQKDLERKMNEAREKVVPLVRALTEAQEALSPQAPTRKQVDTVEETAKRAQDAVDDYKDLFKKDPDFAAWAKSQRGKAEKALDAASSARKKVKFLEGPAAAKAEAEAKLKDGKVQKDPAERARRMVDAKEKYEECIKEGEKQLADQELATAAITYAGKTTAPQLLVAACRTEVKDVDKELAKLQALADKQKAKEEAARKKKEAAEKKKEEARKKAEAAKAKRKK